MDHLSPEDAGIILELSQKLDITAAERLAKAVTDRKFYIETTQSEKHLLVVHTTEHYDWLEGDFRMCEYLDASGINVMRPVSMGTFRDGTMAYQLYTWYDGEDLAEALPRMNSAELYSAGKKTGVVLRKMHSLPPLRETEPWRIRFGHKVKEEIQFYNDKPVKFRSGDLLVQYLQDNLELLENRPQTFVHGDFNCGNLMFTPDAQIGVIDLGWGNNCNDPWWDFREMLCNPNLPSHFATGLIKGYFDGEPPLEFFRLLSYYLVFGALRDSRDHIGEDDPEWTKAYLNWFDNMQNPVPSWYLKDFHVQHIDGIPCRLKEPFDFSFLGKYGKVFKIWDEQASGCICFGVSDGEYKYFIKFAGVRTINNFNLPVSDAIARLKAAVIKYREMAHPLLIRLLEAKKVRNGYMVVFDWFDGESFSVEIPLLYEKFKALPNDKKIYVYEEILRFHEYAT